VEKYEKQISFMALRRAMPCHLCCQRKIDLMKFEHLRDGVSAERVVRKESVA
jgi:hypothetical protein